MKVTDFSKQVSLQEGKKKSMDIAQISEILKVANNLLGGELYSAIRKLPDTNFKTTIINPSKTKNKNGIATKTKKS